MTHLLQVVLMYVLVPLWLVAGLADYGCHRMTRIEESSGPKESILHIAQFVQVGSGLLAALWLEVNTLVLAFMVLCALLHQATAVWDVSYANATRWVPPVEQHIHGVLESLPFVALMLVAILHWDSATSPDFALSWKSPALPAWYLTAVMAAAAVLGIVPYGEELARTIRHRSG